MTGVLEGLRAALADRYHVERELGHGAMATVYLARDLRLHRPVAVKVLLPFLSAALGPERFLREINIVAGFNHPNIVPLFDSGEADGLLYYVMPYIEGESLHERLRRECQLPVPVAVSIARQILDGLGYAHAQGIVHRDVKPANVMLTGDRALVADFGIARAIRHAASEERLTETGIALGTPAYMSPEQAGAESELDGRSDLYATGCVLYEMLTGRPPFTGPTAQAILARHQLDPVPPIRTVRRTVSVEVERAVLRALEKVPADRHTTASEFTRALDAPPAPVPPTVPWWRLVVWPAGVAAAGLVIYLAVKDLVPDDVGGAAGLDSTRYAILPFERDSGVGAFNEDQLLQDAMLQWTGITAVDRPRMQDALSRHGTRLTSGVAEAIARQVGAGRYVLSQVSRIGDSLRVHSAVYRTMARGPPVHEGTVKIGWNLSQAGGAFSRIADRLLFGAAGPGARLGPPKGTSSRPARQALELGLDSVYNWNLTAADSAFNAAARSDPQFAEALLWLAQVRSWNGAPVATWQSAAERAWAQRDQLSPRDRLRSDALLAIGRDSLERACPIWRRAAVLNPIDFVVWYGLASCLSADKAVLRDPRSPSGWRFRTSHHEATLAYVRAFHLLPSIHGSFSGSSYLSVRTLLWTSGDALRSGSAVPPDSGLFAAYPALQRDTLAFYPNPIDKLVVPTTTDLAIRRERELFHDLAAAWVAEYPRSAEALEALAISLGLLGNPAALEAVRQARGLAVTPEQRIRTAGAEVWMRIKFGIPADLRSLSVARAIADSLLEAFPPGAPEPLLLASIAVVTGHVARAAAYSRDPRAASERGVPPLLVETALPLTVFSALGVPEDSIRALEQQTVAIIDNALSLPLRERARAEWLVRPAALAFPDYRYRSLPELKGSYDLLDAQVAFAQGDPAPARRLFTRLRIERRFVQPVNRSIEVLFVEARLMSSLGEDSAAAAWLDPTLAALPAMAPEVFHDLPRPAALVRAMALRAELAERVGDQSAAARWARIVTVLWTNADPFLQPVVHRMTRLAR
jgi:hypothetical protein